MKNKQKNIYTPLDDYEKELEEFLDKGDYVIKPLSGKTKKILMEAAKNHIELKKSKSITLRIKNEDLMGVKAKAKETGVPYQTLIGLLIRQYVKGETKMVL